MKEVKEYLEGLEPELRKEVCHRMVARFVGLEKLADTPTCSGNNGCTPTTPNGECEVINGVCVWVPDIG